MNRYVAPVFRVTQAVRLVSAADPIRGAERRVYYTATTMVLAIAILYSPFYYPVHIVRGYTVFLVYCFSASRDKYLNTVQNGFAL